MQLKLVRFIGTTFEFRKMEMEMEMETKLFIFTAVRFAMA